MEVDKMSSCRISEHELLTQRNKLKLYRKDIQRYLAQATKVKDTLQYNLYIFRGEKEIWPDQCSYAISCLDKTHTIWQKQCQLFDEIASFFLIASPDSPVNEFAIILHYINRENSQLICLIAAFRSICRRPSRQNKKRRQEIACRFELFIQTTNDLIQRICNFLEETRQEKFILVPLDERIASASEEYVEEKQQPIIDEIAGLPDQSRQVGHFVVVGKDYKGYENYVEGNDNPENVSELSIRSSIKDPLEV